MRVLVSGSSGFVGSALVPYLASQGHAVVRLVRRADQPGTVTWDPDAGTIDRAGLEGLDGVVHLAGESIVGRWTPAKKAAIRESRVRGTTLLCDTLAQLRRPPRVLVCASATGIYGHRDDERLTEASAPGAGFLADVGRAWEAATAPAAQHGIRVVNARFGMVLDARGGALKKMAPPFRLGVGGILGDGRQYMSWIALDDLVAIVEFCLTNDAVRGPVNVVAPQPVTNYEFTKTLGRVLHRPTICPAPVFVVRLLFGEMGDAILLESARVEPARLQAAGYAFRYPELDAALRHALQPRA